MILNDPEAYRQPNARALFLGREVRVEHVAYVLGREAFGRQVGLLAALVLITYVDWFSLCLLGGASAQAP